MGKQINYWMEYESFLIIAGVAIEKGCVIFKNHQEKIIHAKDLSIVTNDCKDYYFHLPVAGEVEIRTLQDGREFVNNSNSSTGNAVIEAGFSYINDKKITRSRLYVKSGYYNDCEEWVPRPDCMTDLYNSLSRKAKKVAPYTELIDIRTHTHGEHYGEEFEWKHKEYITAHCLDLREKGYSIY